MEKNKKSQKGPLQFGPNYVKKQNKTTIKHDLCLQTDRDTQGWEEDSFRWLARGTCFFYFFKCYFCILN